MKTLEEKQLNSQESLELISRMINNTKKKFEKGGGQIFLIWGYASFIISLCVYALLFFTKNEMFNWLWFAIPLVGSPLMFYVKTKETAGVTTYLDKIINSLWLVIGVVVVVIPLVTAFINYRFPILMVDGILLTIGMILTGIIINSKATISAGVVGMLLAFSTLFIAGNERIIIFAAMSLVSMIIPGHYLSYKEKRNEI